MRRGVGEEFGEPILALLKGPLPPVRAVQVKGIGDHLAVMGAVVEFVEDRQPIAVAPHTASPSIVADAVRRAATAFQIQG
jgi:hypothetical protein